MNIFFDKKGHPISMDDWANKFKDDNYKHIALDKLPNKKRVSTVWLGLEHGVIDGERLLFETMVFPSEGWCELDMKRYATEEEAIKGHKKMVKKWSKKK